MEIKAFALPPEECGEMRYYMLAALVLGTFICFVVVDYFLQAQRSQAGKAVLAPPEPEGVSFPMNIVGGFKLPAGLSYHSGHAWAAKESRNIVRIGLDDFAVRLLGKIDQLDLPARGRWLRQGEKGWTLARGGHRFEMLSPIEGEVVDVNPEVLKDPSVIHKDPYGVGWLVAVNSPAADSNLKNLLRGSLAQRWMEESVSALHAHCDSSTGVHLQDGGHAIPDLLSVLPEDRWDRVVRELFLA
jgi:glycine cleavage system H lipoate-binding protein